MRFKRVLLVSPPSSSYLGAARPPQNLGYLAQALCDAHIDYQVMDMRFGHKPKHLMRRIETFQPDLIGITMVSLEYKNTYKLISQIKQQYPSLSVVVGGPHITVLQNRVLNDCSDIDYGVVHEGEKTLVEFCQGIIDENQISGLIRRENGYIVYNGHRNYPNYLDEISWPRYEKFEMNYYINEIPLNSSRGCPYRCVFCPNKIITKKFRYRSALHVVDEIQYWYDQGYRVFNFDDDNFCFHNNRVYDICDEIEKRGIKNAEFRCSNGLRADRINRNLLSRMREVGFNYIAFGVDGGNNRMLKINKKDETIEQIEEAIKNACDLGFDVKIFVITGMPQETKEDIEDSLKLVEKYPIKRAILNNPIPYPGTELFETVKRNNWFLKQPEEYLNDVTENENIPVFETPQLSREERIKILKRIRKIEKKITCKGIKQIYKKYYVIRTILAYLFATDFVERQFFKNMIFRRIVEYLRYKWMIKKQRELQNSIL